MEDDIRHGYWYGRIRGQEKVQCCWGLRGRQYKGGQSINGPKKMGVNGMGSEVMKL